MKPEELRDGQTVEARFSCRDNEDGTAPDWGKWETVSLCLRRREEDLPKHQRNHRNSLKDDIIALGVDGRAWASYSQSDYCAEYDEWLAEEYRMQLRKKK